MQRSGFAAIELVVTMLVTVAFAVVAVPAVRSAKDNGDLHADHLALMKSVIYTAVD
ncbi:MAG: hypothetical protein NXI04_28795 [Planctomycetaceae bacterium]|nr:hypothetical protein [Planctomycetaceae bacterium]